LAGTKVEKLGGKKNFEGGVLLLLSDVVVVLWHRHDVDLHPEDVDQVGDVEDGLAEENRETLYAEKRSFLKVEHIFQHVTVGAWTCTTLQ
jgi:hypothetical protein